MATVAETVAQARQHHQRGDLHKAEQLYREALAAEPNNAAVLFLLGTACHLLKKMPDAVACYQRAIRAQPDMAEAHHNLGVALAQQRRLDEAIGHYRTALQLRPGYADAHNSLGAAYKGQGKVAEAVACFRQAVRCNPDYADAYLNLGIALFQQGSYADAAEAFRNLVRLRPNAAVAHNHLGEALKEQGKFADAAGCFREALRLRPNIPEVMSNLAGAVQQHGKLDEAVELYRQALRLRPAAEWTVNLGAALADLGRLDEAVKTYQEAIRLNPRLPEAHNNLGNAYKMMGRSADAMPCYEAALRLRPTYAKVHNNRAVLLAEQGRHEEAIAGYREAIRLQPNYPDAHHNLGASLAEQGRYAEAIACYQQALRYKSDYVDAYNHLGIALHEVGNIPEAMRFYREALRIKPDFADAQNNLANAYKEQNKLDEAAAHYAVAVRLKPEYPRAYCNWAYTVLERGDVEESEALCKKALAIDPGYPHALYVLSELAAQGRYRFTDEQIAQVRAGFDRPNLAPNDRMLLHFTLATYLNGRKEYDAAFEHFRHANDCRHQQLVKTGVAFKQETHRRLVDRITGMFTPDFFAARRGYGVDSRVPILILGMPRSGTSLVEQVLASHPKVHGAGELKEVSQLAVALAQQVKVNELYTPELAALGPEAYRPLAEKHLGRLAELGGPAERVTDKMPENFLHVGLAALLFPRVRVIHCRRDPLDTCVSCYFQNFKGLYFTWKLDDLGFYYREYERLMAHWRAALPVPMLEVKYEELVADLEGVGRRMVAFAGLDWDPRCLAFHETVRPVHTMSKLQVRQPVYKSSVARWRRYARHLGPLMDAMGWPAERQAAVLAGGGA